MIFPTLKDSDSLTLVHVCWSFIYSLTHSAKVVFLSVCLSRSRCVCVCCVCKAACKFKFENFHNCSAAKCNLHRWIRWKRWQIIIKMRKERIDSVVVLVHLQDIWSAALEKHEFRFSFFILIVFFLLQILFSSISFA